MVEFANLSEMPEGHIKETVERAKGQMEVLQASLEYNVLTVQLMVGNDDRVQVAVVAHNPCNLRQYQVVAFLPTLDDNLEMLSTNEKMKNVIGTLEDDVDGNPMTENIVELCMKRFMHASTTDPEFLLRFHNTNNFQEARELYQEYYELTEGGDFNHPLQERS